MCKCLAKGLGRLIAAILKCAAMTVAFVLFLAAVGPLNKTLGGSVPTSATVASPAPYNQIGVSVFYAGIADFIVNDTNLASSSVAWVDLNTANTCQNNTLVFQNWALPLGICVPCTNNDTTSSNTHCFQLPSEVVSQQAVLVLAILITGILAILRLFGVLCEARCRYLVRVDTKVC
jgi:hypothetical protein